MKCAEQMDGWECSQAIIGCRLVCFLTCFLLLRGKGDRKEGWVECCHFEPIQSHLGSNPLSCFTLQGLYA